MFGKVVQFLQTTPLPGSIVSKSGEIIFLNQKMMDLVNLNESSHVYKCSWLAGKDHGSCPDCAETPVLEGRCFLTRDDSAVTLLTAVRVRQAHGALVRLYSTDTSLSHSEAEIHTNRLLKIASPDIASGEADGPVNFNGDWLSGASLWEITQNVIESQYVHPVKIKNLITKNLHVKATNPMLIGRIITKVLFELYTIKTHGSIKIKT